jgi:hypothetical protein
MHRAPVENSTGAFVFMGSGFWHPFSDLRSLSSDGTHAECGNSSRTEQRNR